MSIITNPERFITTIQVHLRHRGLIRISPTFNRNMNTANRVRPPSTRHLFKRLFNNNFRVIFRTFTPIVRHTHMIRTRTLSISGLRSNFTSLNNGRQRIQRLAIKRRMLLSRVPNTTSRQPTIDIFNNSTIIRRRATLLRYTRGGITMLNGIHITGIFGRTSTSRFIRASILQRVTVVRRLRFSRVFRPFLFSPLANRHRLFLTRNGTRRFHTAFAHHMAHRATPTTASVRRVFTQLRPRLTTRITRFNLLHLFRQLTTNLRMNTKVHRITIRPRLMGHIKRIMIMKGHLNINFLIINRSRQLAINVTRWHLTPFVTSTSRITSQTFRLGLTFSRDDT